ncbi:A/G-specific adenine glycosylase [Candidatus Acetothermia bacterium]|nr:A/G-specific adenine glycosylase [Candidatus Acetothermia bacterium]
MPKFSIRPLAITQELLSWYKRFQRELPWRKTKDPYKIWISEIMLQQTQVETVKPYYGRFLKKFPTVKKLANAPLDEVLKVWEGLGYYARARHLHQAAQCILSEHQGKIPCNRAELLRLPGIGRYTVGAILSIAYGQDEPALDGNLQRVLCRLFNIDKDPKLGVTQKKLWQLARDLLPLGQAGLFNQALMDLGATICIPGEPRCLICPLMHLCEARRVGRQSLLPVKSIKRSLPHYDVAVGIVHKSGKILITRRPEKGLLGGLWEFPGGKRKIKESLKVCVKREIKEEVGIEIEVEAPLVIVRHAYSHFRVTLHAFHCRFVKGRARALGCSDWAWIDLSEIDQYAFPSANHKILAALQKAIPKSASG